MIKLVYIDEETGWQSQAHAALADRYEMHIPEVLPNDVADIWEEVAESQIALIDFRLNESGQVGYTGDDVVREIHKHNKHYPVIIITSFEDNAIQECTETQTIRGKEMFTESKMLLKLCHMIDSAVNLYDKKKTRCEDLIQGLQNKLATGSMLSEKEEADRFDAELYLADLNADASVRANLIATRTSKDLEKLLQMARTIIANHQ